MEVAAEIAAAPSVTAAQVAALLDGLRAAQTRLARRPVSSIVAALETTVANWLDPDTGWRRAAEHALPATTGFSPEMIRYALPSLIEPLRTPALGNLLEAELGDRRRLDTFVDARRVAGPAVILHLLSGNIPGLAAIPAALSLAIKSSALLKASRGDRIFPALFAQSVATVDPELGECVAACYWPGGDRSCERPAFAAADLVVAAGADTTLADVRRRCPARFIGHGHKVSFAVVTTQALGSGDLARRAAADLALDASVWDQQGCLSPQLCFVEADFAAACTFAQLVGHALAEVAERLPPGPKGNEEQIAVHRFRDEARWALFGGERALVLEPPASTAWTVIVEPAPSFQPTPLWRSLRILPLPDLADLSSLLVPVRSVLEGAGLAATPERGIQIAALLARAGVHLVTPLGQMQRPPLTWSQGGRPRIADWVSWCERYEPAAC